MYEFVAKVGEDILRTMSLNWQQMCKIVLPSIDGEMTLDEEKQVLARVTKNIYHRKPSILPITFSQTSLLTFVSEVNHFTGTTCGNFSFES